MLTNEDKPRKLSVKDFLIKKLAVKMMVSETVINTVVNDQFLSAIKAMETNKSIELSGFGKFLFKEGRARKLEQPTIDMLEGRKPIPRAGSEHNLRKQLEFIQTKLYGTKKDSGGLDKQHNQEGGSGGSSQG